MMVKVLATVSAQVMANGLATAPAAQLVVEREQHYAAHPRHNPPYDLPPTKESRQTQPDKQTHPTIS
jgi:hypothetical protein